MALAGARLADHDRLNADAWAASAASVAAADRRTRSSRLTGPDSGGALERDGPEQAVIPAVPAVPAAAMVLVAATFSPDRLEGGRL